MTVAGRAREGQWIYRYPVVVRVSHWVNALCIMVLAMSGLQIFNAHPSLYWGEQSDFDRPLLSIYVGFASEGRPLGVTSIFGQQFDTTGILGRSVYRGRPVHRAFPAWATIPSVQDLATGRVWHFFFAWLFVLNGLIYVGHALVSGRFARDLVPVPGDFRRIGATVRDHVLFRLRRPAGSAKYNILQQLTYLSVVLVLAPIAALTGLTMSPAMVAAMPWLLDVFGGRQSARTIHFVVTWLFLLFVLVHVAMVLVSGFFNNMRSMITGWRSSVSH
jgi:Ni/Fe-hydrogenase b-type cytochrome subunit